MASIQTKFMLLILGGVLLASFVIGGAGIVNSKSTVDQNSAQIMNLMCSNKMNELNGLLSRIEASVNTLAVYALDSLESVEKLKNDQAYLEEYTKHLESIAVNAASNTDGAMGVYVRFNPDFTPPTSGLFWSKTVLNGKFQRLTPTDLSKYSPQDTGRVGWYYTPTKSGKPVWMDPYINQNIKVQMISYVIPLYMEHEIIGIVGMDIDFSAITYITDVSRTYKSGYTFLTTAQGKVLHHPVVPAGTLMGSTDKTLVPVVSELEHETSGNQLFTYNWGGIEKKMAFRSLSNGMRLVITAPACEIDEAKNQLIYQIFLAILAISSISVVVTIVVTRKIIGPLRELTTAAQKVAAGDLNVSVTYKSNDEVGTLADSFRETVSHLKKYIDYINGLAYRDTMTGVKNKTAYLEAVNRIEDRIRIEQPEFAVVVFDVNNLKWINDTFGHDFGDMIIIESCKLICKTFKRSPVYRIGGDEFVSILEHGDLKNYQALMDRFQTNVTEYNRHVHDEHSKVSIASGIALYDYEIDLAFANVFKRADEAMYHNKAVIKDSEDTFNNKHE